MNAPAVVIHTCDNCGEDWTADQLVHVFPDIPGLLSRLDVGGEVPSGECPGCGALTYQHQPLDPPEYALRVHQLEREGLCTSDAQGVADAEFGRAGL